MKIGKTWMLGLVLGLAFVVSACDDDDNGTPTSPSMPIMDVLLRVAHLSPDAPAVDVLVNGDVVLSDVPFRTVSDYLELSAGEYRIQVTPAGNPSAVVIDATVSLQSNVVYTVAATGLLSAGTLEPLILVDDRSIASGARVRFVHTAPDAPAVDLAVADGPVLFGDVTFQESSDYGEVDPGTVDLEVRVAGTSTVALPLPGVDLAGGTTYSAFAIGLLSDGSLDALLIQDAP